MALTTTEVIGFADEILEAMQQNKAELQAKGVDVTAWITEALGLKNDAVQKNHQQEMLKAQMKETTEQTQKALDSTYTFCSSKLDAMIGAYGKTSELGKRLQKIRSEVRRGPQHAAKPAEKP